MSDRFRSETDRTAKKSMPNLSLPATVAREAQKRCLVHLVKAGQVFVVVQKID
jgi:hypothetical protein